MRIFENTGTSAAAPGTGAQTLLDGSIIVSGSYSNALTDQRESQLRSFTVQPRDTILSYSNIVTTQGSDAIRDQAAARDISILVQGPTGTGKEVCMRLAELGILAKDTHDHTIRVAPPLVITGDQVDWALEQIGAVLTQDLT